MKRNWSVVMSDYLTQEFVEESNEIKQELNQQLNEWSAPTIGQFDEEYERTESFVAFNEWLKDVEQEKLQQLASSFGLLPAVYSLSGINVLQATLLQDATKIDMLGIISYIRTVLHQNIEYKSQMDDACQTVFPDNTDIESDTRSLFISLFISQCMNTHEDITYPQSLSRIMQPILAG